ncbi:BT4734/BF3469 family protein [Flavobacterium sp. GT3R68]|uniref:BT4734/BF3469 family protein n=1 Tax=Flavobacterium sp. GT3R68 TaxID=2594437 RepID=UPI000F8600D8|nr:BT4734/BF3469 family protein [Flavobacterium sp. GT3R68]RTY89647.1 hypothetical protein EKL32_22225 [Flavobacterium sp. GSN2]TRW89466.1 hypothetical protein FNW07_13285 [Flavobacterium sp. GT3R68]
MKNLSKIKITCFDNMKSTNCRSMLLFEEFGNIKRGKYRDLIVTCRNAVSNGDKNLYAKLKSNLPAVTFCGEFLEGHKVADMVTYNNLMVIDIDNLDINKLQDINQDLRKDKYITALWLSPSGLGLKGIIKIDSDVNKHKAVFNALRIYFLDNYQIELDKSGSDVSRLCFSSWDENLYYNPDGQIFDDILEVEEVRVAKNLRPTVKQLVGKSAYATEGLNKRDDKILMRDILRFLEKRDISITDNYDAWVKVGLGLSYTFSYDVGETFFLKLCRLDKDKHSEEQSINLLKYCYNKRQLDKTHIISFATIIYYAKQKGFKP